MSAIDLIRNANVFTNPLTVRGVRARLRFKDAAAWGLVTVGVVTFLFLIIYLTGVNRDLSTPEAAAKVTLIPMMGVQGVILMLMGTGAIAGGLARDRMAGVLNYQRLTPMSPTAKIVGLLFGLPAREYLMFALTLPLVAYAVWRSGLPLGKVAQFYIVFMSSVWLYHMTAMTAGITASKPWRATMLAQGMVVMLYVILPNLTYVGFSFLEFLTVLPTFWRLLGEELAIDPDLSERLRIRRWEEFRFFQMSLHPIVCTLVLQGFVIATLFTVVYRKWNNEAAHPISKHAALLFFACTQFFVIGSLWPNIVDNQLFDELLNRVNLPAFEADSQLILLWIIFFIGLGIAGTLGGAIIHLISPDGHTTLRGWRRARKHGRRLLPWTSDAASGMPVTLGIIALVFVSYWLLWSLAIRSHRFGAYEPGVFESFAAPAYIGLLLLTVQLVRELYSLRTALVLGFVCWAVPFFAFLILIAAHGDEVLAMYCGLISPPLGLYTTQTLMMRSAAEGLGTRFHLVSHDLLPHLRPLTLLSLGGYGVLCAILGTQWLLRRRKLRTLGLTAPESPKLEPPPAPPIEQIVF